jgi:hypothetical protein
MGGTTPNSDIQTNRPFRSLKLLLGLAATAVAIWCTGVGPLLWYQGTHLLPDRAGFGYYRDFNLVRDALESIAPLFKANYDNPAVPRITYKDPIYNRCLQVEILEEGRGNEFNYKRR